MVSVSRKAVKYAKVPMVVSHNSVRATVGVYVVWIFRNKRFENT